MNSRLLLTVLFLLPGVLIAQRMELLKDINQDQTSISIDRSVIANNMLFMNLYEGNTYKLWRTDGTTDGTIQLTDDQTLSGGHLISVNSYVVFSKFYKDTTWLYRSDGTVEGTYAIHKTPSSIYNLIADVKGTIYFSVRISYPGNRFGPELWKTDGTAAGTKLVKALGIYADGEPHLNDIPQLFDFFDFNGKLSFVIYINSSLTSVLWLSDGTEAGTQPVDTLTSGYSQPVILGDVMYFGQGNGLYKSDGKTVTMVKEGLSIKQAPVVIGKTIYFAAHVVKDGTELWKSDGTAEGTFMVKNIYPRTSNSSFPMDLTNVNGTLYFKARTANGIHLWKSNGTAEGTIQVSSTKLSESSYYPSEFTAVGNQIVFPDESGKLYKSDGTKAGTQQLTSFGVRIHGRLGNEVYFSGSDGNGNQLYKTDLTTAGTKVIRNKYSTADSNPRQLTDVNGTAFFIASPHEGKFDLWKSNGTPDGTIQIKSIHTNRSDNPPGLLTPVKGGLYFVVNRNELWKSNGTTEGTVQVYKDNDRFGANYFNEFIETDKTLIIKQDDHNLWRTDGTTEGTNRFIGKNYVQFGEISGMTNVNETVFFGSLKERINPLTGEYQRYTDLWKTNGETEGSILLRTFKPHATFNPVAFKGELYFGAWDETNSVELWKSDGTTNGTRVVSHVTESMGKILEEPGTILAAGNYLYYITNAAGSYPLVRTDGTQAGTKVIKTLFPGMHLKNFNLYTGSGLVYLTAHDSDHNLELLWRTDGTEAGTYQLGSFDAYEPGDYTRDGPAIRIKGEVNGKLLFVLLSRQLSNQLWATDGTPEGTNMLAETVSKPFYFNFASAVRYGNLFYFTMPGQQTGTELWQSDGTPEGTHFTIGLNPKGSEVNTELAVIGGTLLMAASNGNTGVELYRYIQSPDQDQTVYPVADAYIRNVPYEKTNFGTSEELGVKAGSREGYQRKTYLKFPLTGTGNVTSAKLRVYGYNDQNEQNVNLSITGIENDNWTETGIIWPNAPSVTGEILDSAYVNHLPRYHEMDVTGFVQTQLAGDKTATFVLTDPTENNIRLFLSSRENKVNPPELILSTQSSSGARMAALNEPEIKRKDASVLYPNPVRDRFSVQLSEQHKGTAQFMLINPNGKTQQLNAAKDTAMMQIDISSMKLTAGKYLLQIKSESHQETLNVVVSN
ncbi:DNRLRE domain-containing protein [Dyadobacter flavalbus]|uniref:DNRLRE domain-containing protein n=1 Tax=Dyadobacter flavalbus TaxID=2579942 RepID=A0A5M8QUL7_9BACT|nr:DNRLRE domain-containing protein [Dyadobacter flavalbus]KAA6438991.1 DNRLRE domain-containing protein [Dyadobacter flavalbus]